MAKFDGDGPSNIERDGKKFDARFRKYCFQLICRFRFRCLKRQYQTQENWNRLCNLYRMVYGSPFVNIDGHVFGRGVGNSSGQACTTPDNTLKNFLDDCVLFMLCVPKEMHTYAHYKEYKLSCINGDDINDAIHPVIQKYWNHEALARVAPEIDMLYHYAADKFVNAYETTFLGHKFVLTDIPVLGQRMFLPHGDCNKLRTSMRIYNEEQTIWHTIIRACGLRLESFACEGCRNWFEELLEYLRDRTLSYQGSPEWKNAWSCYLSDDRIWRIYTGIESVVRIEN
jgi:hypothetical protein